MSIEILKNRAVKPGEIRAAIFDFDGTLSTLRCGWEEVMRPMMMEMIGAEKLPDDRELRRAVNEYIEESAGIQTIYQMRWLANEVKKRGLNPQAHDGWWYKEEYNRRLMRQVSARVANLESGKEKPEQYLIEGTRAFLSALKNKGVEICVASGTDHPDVVREAEVLGLTGYFSFIKGAPPRKAACSKEAVIRMVMEEKGLPGARLLMVGDGKVEIALGAENGALALGVASDEAAGKGVSPVKRRRLIQAGAHAIVGDFSATAELMDYLKI
ncbi:MAG: HAD family hydrolase [Clostridiales bacterium]|jgi:phosphoglycolate phosphatase-like HAD superfamily hydrolase|nr:HAD family hydrolase [Clostridiales bacterium]